MCSSGDTTQGLATITPTTPTTTTSSSTLPLISPHNTHSPHLSPVTVSPVSATLPTTSCYDEWVHIDMSPDNTAMTAGTYIYIH